jgi:4-hydroxy-tetrahydrodipicolinate synthase
VARHTTNGESIVKYRRNEAKEYARQNLRGIWAATLTPFNSGDLSVDESGWRKNLRHWYRDLGIRGLFVNGKQGEFGSMTVAERKRTVELAVEAAGTDRGVMVSCSDQSLDTVIELAQHAQHVGADYIVVHTPLLYFGAHSADTLVEYYRYIAEHVDIGVTLWNQPPDCGYTLEPEVCMRIAEIPNVVAIKYSVPRELYSRLTAMARGKLIVSTSNEGDWLSNIVELGWQVYLCSTPPYLMQTPEDRRMHEYTGLAMAGQAEKAEKVQRSLDPVRRALKESRPEGKAAAHQKYWQELLGQTGGPVRRPLLNLTADEKATIRSAFTSCGLGRTSKAVESTQSSSTLVR